MKIILMFFAVLVVNTIYSQQDVKLEFSPYSDTIQVNHLNKNIGELLFKYVKKHIDFIQYDDINNCDIRSHLICTVLEKKFYNLKTGKAWLFADSKRASKKYFYKREKLLKPISENRRFYMGLSRCSFCNY